MSGVKAGKVGPKAAATVAENNPLYHYYKLGRARDQSNEELTKRRVVLASLFHASTISSSSLREISKYMANITSEPSIASTSK